MTDYIRRDVLSELVGEPIEVFLGRLDLKLPPTVEAEPVRHGRWIKRDDGRVRPFWDSYRCSECLITSSYSPFCPNCGAKMDGERE